MSNETYWALKRREWAAKAASPKRVRVTRSLPREVVEVPPPVVIEEEPAEVSYRDLQAQAKDLDIPANQTREELEAAIAEKAD
jgi:hypothetical protein